MTRLWSALKTDVIIQARNNFYTIGIGAGVLVAVMLAWLASPEQLPAILPAVLLIAIGGSTLVYVGGLIIFEKDQGTLNANIVSPLRPAEYLWSKVISLAGLAALESLVVVGVHALLASLWGETRLPNFPALLAGILGIGVVYTLIGIILIVRFDSLTDFLVPMSALAMVLQLPFLYFLGWVRHPILLIIPTSAPGLLLRAAYVPLAAWEWFYALGYTAVLVVGLAAWAQRAFHTHVILKVG